MDCRKFLTRSVVTLGCAVVVSWLSGCRNHQYAHVLTDDKPDMVGSHSAGAETFNPLIELAVSQLLGRHAPGAHGHFASHDPNALPSGKLSICFIGVENKSIEELGDFKDQIYQQIDTMIVQSEAFQPISKRFIDAGLRETRLRPDSLFVPANTRIFVNMMERMGQPFDYMLYATITSGSTENNHSYQRDYLLTLDMVNIHDGTYDKQSAKIRKGYHRSRMGAIKNYNPFKMQ